MPEFTQDWFSHNIPGLERVMSLLPEKQHFLEIGAFEGRSTLWFHDRLDDVADAYIDVVDTFEGSEEHSGIDFKAVRNRFAVNTYGLDKIIMHVGSLRDFPYSRWHTYNFIYIDGSHQAPDVLADACMSWPMLKKGGIMVFDDYLWGFNEDPLHTPKMAVDAFMACYHEQLEVVLAGYQWGVRKL